jgi:hypothetical protein
VLILLAKTSSMTDEIISGYETIIANYQSNNPLPKGWSIQVYGGPNASIDDFEQTHETNNAWLTKNTSIISNNQSVQPDFEHNPPNTYAIDQNNFPTGNGPVTSQEASWYSPNFNYSPTLGTPGINSFLLDNLWTNTGCFLQAGQEFADRVGPINCWGDSAETIPLKPQPFSVTYHTGDYCEFNIQYISGCWNMICEDFTTGKFQFVPDSNITGTQAALTTNTSVWFETYETTSYNPTFWQNFNSPNYTISVTMGIDTQNSQGGLWWDQDIPILENYLGISIPDNVISGGLAHYGTVTLNLQNMPLSP